MGELFNIGGFLFLLLALVGLILFILGIIFLIKNIKWKGEKDRAGIKSTSNVVGIVCFSLMIFFGGCWLAGFGAGAIAFFLIGGL